MKQRNKVFVFFIVIVYPLIFYGQEPSGFTNDITIIYGIFGFREVDDAIIYEKTSSTGVYGARYMLHFDNKYAIGIEGAYENTDLVLKSNQMSDNFYLKSFFLTGRLRYTLLERKRVQLYIAGAFGIKRIDKYVLEEKLISTELAKEITLIGLQFKLLSNILLFIELTNGDIALLKFGLTYSFGKGI